MLGLGMEFRVCRLCGVSKGIDRYHVNNKSRGGRDTRCADCKNSEKRKRLSTSDGKEAAAKYYTSEDYKKKRAIRKLNNGGYFNLIQKRIDELNNKEIAGSKYISRDEAIDLGLKRYFDGSECKRGHISERMVCNRCCCACTLEKSRSDAYKGMKSKYYQENKSKLISAGVKRQRERYAESVNYKASVAARNMLKRVLYIGGSKKTGGSYEMLGYNRDQLINHIASLFKDGMSWENYGEWHIDHKKPVSWFINNGIKDPSIINALSNLQPLWAEDNFKKGDSVDVTTT
ncbi:hypothetical protein [Vibrio phage vB_VcM_SY]